jgi:hypothetical protein
MRLNNLIRIPQLSIVTLFVVISLAVLAGATISLGGVNVAIALLVAILGVMILARLDKGAFLLFAIIVVSASSLNFWLQRRFEVLGAPVGVPDVLVIAYGVYGLYRWLKGGMPYPLGRIGKLVTIWFLYNSAVGVTLGALSGNPPYAIFQEYRLILYSTVSFLATMVVFRPKRHLPAILWGMLAAGVLASAWQMGISVSGRDVLADQAVYVGTDFIGRTLRDVSIPLYFAGPALMVLVAAQFEAPVLLGRARLALWSMVPLLLVAPLLSMTRTVWVAIALTTFLVFLYVIRHSLSRRRLPTLIVFLVAVALCLVLVSQLLRIFLPNVYEGAILAVQYTFEAADRTAAERLNIPMRLLASFSENGWHFLTGIGFGNMWSGAIQQGPFNNLHVVYLSYLVIGGVPGMILFLLVWSTPVPLYYRLLFHRGSRPLDPTTRVYVLAAAANWVMLTIIMAVMPPHWAEAAWFGISLAVVSTLDTLFSDTVPLPD